MKLVRFLKPMPEHSANIGDEMGFPDEKAAEIVAKGRAKFMALPVMVGAVVQLEAEPEIVEKVAKSASVPYEKLKELMADREYEVVEEPEQAPALAGDYEDEPVRRGPGRPRKHF